jgi:hypothetical protein
MQELAKHVNPFFFLTMVGNTSTIRENQKEN